MIGALFVFGGLLLLGFGLLLWGTFTLKEKPGGDQFKIGPGGSG